jgi:hypothetical protein
LVIAASRVQMTAYQAYGVRLESEIPLPGLPAAHGGEPGTVRVLLDESSERKTSEAPDAEYLVQGRPLSFHVNGDLEIDWREIVHFRVSIADSRIRCGRGRDGSAEHLRDWLLHYALPLLLAGGGRLRFLHGSAVQIGRRAVGFLAPSGGGKTTLAEYFHGRGHGFFTDEKLGVASHEQQFVAVPSTPFYRRDETFPRWRLVDHYAPSALPLGALYAIVPAGGEAEPAIEPVSAGEAAFELARHCEFELPPGVRARLRLPSSRHTSFEFCTRIAAATRVCRLIVPRARARLSAVYETVLADAEQAA